jgi:putative transposase
MCPCFLLTNSILYNILLAMPRIPRAVLAGYPHHVVQRGNNRGNTFFDEKDKWVYLYLLKKYAEKWACSILAYCLMPDHVHLLLKPMKENSLSKTMQGLTLCYTQYINKKYNKSGRLWENRFYSCIVDKENYLWQAARYIEQNPSRAGIVNRVEEYLYSSAIARVAGVGDKVVDEEIFEETGRSEYVDFLRSTARDDEINEIRYCTRTGRPFGSEIFVRAIEQSLGRDLMRRPRGRPRKKPLQYSDSATFK